MDGTSRGAIERSAQDGPHTIEVSADASWFRVDGGPAVDLSRRRALRDVLRALIERHASAPGEPLTADILIAKSWPGERIRRESACNRLYVAICALRDRGLRAAIQRTPRGYVIARGVRVVRA